MEEFILVQSDLFAPLPGEPAERVSDGMVGNPLGLYLHVAMQQRGHDSHCLPVALAPTRRFGSWRV